MRRGAVLLELMVSVAIFVAAGLTILATVRQGMDSVERARVLEHGADLARTAMSEIEAGIALPESLDGPVGRAGVWSLDIVVNPSEFTGLSVVLITALRERGFDNPANVFELRQLVRLAEPPEDTIGDEDDVIRDARLESRQGRDQ